MGMTHDDVAMFYNHLSITLYLLVTFERASYFLCTQNTNQSVYNFSYNQYQISEYLRRHKFFCLFQYLCDFWKKTQAVWYNDVVLLLYWQMPRYILVPETLIQIIYFKFWRPGIAKVWLTLERNLDFLFSNHGRKAGHLILDFSNFLVPCSQIVVVSLKYFRICCFYILVISQFTGTRILFSWLDCPVNIGLLIVEVLS